MFTLVYIRGVWSYFGTGEGVSFDPGSWQRLCVYAQVHIHSIFEYLCASATARFLEPTPP